MSTSLRCSRMYNLLGYSWMGVESGYWGVTELVSEAPGVTLSYILKRRGCRDGGGVLALGTEPCNLALLPKQSQSQRREPENVGGWCHERAVDRNWASYKHEISREAGYSGNRLVWHWEPPVVSHMPRGRGYQVYGREHAPVRSSVCLLCRNSGRVGWEDWAGWGIRSHLPTPMPNCSRILQGGDRLELPSQDRERKREWDRDREKERNSPRPHYPRLGEIHLRNSLPMLLLKLCSRSATSCFPTDPATWV
ncbi:hypothetical protein SKAU_G00169790 [Synaphobranchus kaupii]|uniref:Uncharacterized protein n=1 Tax=Synaphobranchus kaupii TaxID=118154 RepID=A0A9Q1FK68_SYNKA|nr:hypothetical protein SKAU_G00169790 [Synaphobranchus kaupii]